MKRTITIAVIAPGVLATALTYRAETALGGYRQAIRFYYHLIVQSVKA